MDWEATRVWSEMRAGRYAAADTVVCTDGQNRAAAPRACAGHGGVDSVSTLAAVKRRAQAHRFADSPEARNERTTSQGATVAGGESDTSGARPGRAGDDSTKWGYPVDRNPEVQNPPGYRGMERAIETFPADSTEQGDSTAAAGATNRVNQMQRQDSLESGAEQNPPGYRGMERPAGLDTISAGDTTGSTVRDSTPGGARDSTPDGTRDSTSIGGNDSTPPAEQGNR
jgi:hypothetical protein